MGEACGTDGRDDKLSYFGWKDLKEQTTWRPICRWEDHISMDLREI